MQKQLFLISGFVMVLLLSMFSAAPSAGQTIPTPGPVYMPVVLASGATPAPSATSTRTATPTPAPTNTPTPSSTSLPTDTPTATPTETLDPASIVAVVSSNAFIPYAGANSEYIIGEVVNQTDSNVRFVKINAVLRDKDGKILDGTHSYSFLDRMLPGTTSGFRIIFFDPPTYATYELTVTWDTTNEAPYELQVTNLETYFDSGDAFHARGVVTNQSTDPHTFVKVFIVLYDATGRVIGVDYNYLNPSDLSPGQKVAFDHEVYFWKGKPNQPLVKSYTIRAYDD